MQRDLPASLTVNATYLGTRGTNLIQEFLPNTYPAGTVNPCPTCPAGFVYLTSNGSSSRHAGQLQVRRRLRNGLTASVQYTLAKAEDDAASFQGANLSGSAFAQNWLDLDAEWGPSSFDQRHQVTASFQYTTGVGVAGGALVDGWRGALFKNWTLTGQVTTGSGLPLTPYYLAAVPGTGYTGAIRASLTGASTDAPDGYYLNSAAYTAPAPGTWGNAGRNSARGPAQFGFNAGITRTFPWGSRLNLDYRIDATNVLNTVTYSRREHVDRQHAVRSAERGERDAADPNQPENEVVMRRSLRQRSLGAGVRSAKLAVHALACAVTIAALVVRGDAQQQQPQTQTPQATFRTTTRLIVQSVFVKDKEGKPIEGLTAKDFVITEDGQPQDIAFVEYQRLATEVPAQAADPQAPVPLTAKPATTATTVAPAVQTGISSPPSGDIRYQDKRLIVLYFDGSNMPPGDSIRAYTNALKYINTQMTRSDLVAIMAFQNGAVSVKNDFTDDKEKLREVIGILIYGDDQNNDGIPDHPEGTAFGQNDAEFNIFNTDRQLAALQTAVNMLKGLPEQKTLLYFASGMRLNGADNQAQLRATINAAIRANVTLNPIDARGLVAMPPLGDATQRSPGGLAMFTGGVANQMMNNFQRSQDTLYALAKDTGGKAMFDYNDLSLGIVQATQAVTSYYIIGYYSTHLATDGKYRRVKVSLNNPQYASADLTFRQGYYGDKAFGEFLGVRQGASARRRADARESDHRDHDRAGSELLPVEQRRVLRAGGGEDSRQRARARQAPRRAADADRLHRRGEGRQRLHDPEHARQAGYSVEHRDRREARDQPDSVRDRLHAAARQVRDQAARPRRRNRAHRHVSGRVHRAESDARAEAPADQLSGPQQSAHPDDRRAAHRHRKARRS